MKKNKVRAPVKRVLALGLTAVTIFTATPSMLTVFAAENEVNEIEGSEENGIFVPFRSSFISYLSENSGTTDVETQKVIKYIWMRLLAEQYADSSWSNIYYSAVVLPGGTYLSEDGAKGKYLYSNGTSNSIYDQLLANEIKNEGISFIKSWTGGYTDSFGNVILTEAAGRDEFIKFFDTESTSWTQTAKAIVEVTKTTEGNTWLQDYTYAKNGSNESSIGITLLKLFCVDFDNLNDTQLTWVKAYLPYLLSNYASSGSNALAASNKNAYLYDFMARSVNGAQSTLTKSSATTVSAQGTTLGTVAAGTTLQQEFFNYVVASGTGFGQFVQNIIGGEQYTGAYSNSYDLTGFETVSSMYFGTNDSDIDYYTSSANGGDKDTDWFMHSMYLGSSQFQTVLSLTNNNATAKDWYQKWIARFAGKSGQTISWNYLANQTTNVTNVNSAGSNPTNGYTFFGWGNTNGTTGSRDDDPAAVHAYSYSSTLLLGYNFGRAGGTDGTNPWTTPTRGWNNFKDATFTYYVPINQDYKGANTVIVNLRSTVSVSSPVYVMAVSPAGATINSTTVSATSSSTATLSLKESDWNTYGSIYLKIYVPHSTVEAMGSAVHNKACSFSLSVTGVSLKWNSSQTCIDGHNFGDWIYKYSDDYKTCTLSHTCKTCGVDETENITATVQETNTATNYTYTPVILSSIKAAWTKTITKDLGSGTVTFTAGSGEWTYTNYNYETFHWHPGINGVYYKATQTNALAEALGLVISGNIKANAKYITITSPYTDNVIKAQLINADGSKTLYMAAGSGSVTLDLTDLSLEDKENCYLAIFHNRTVTYTNYEIYKSTDNWNTDFPAATPVSATTTISKVTIAY